MAAVVIGARPVGGGIVTVCGKIGDAGGVVIRLAECVLNLAGEEAGRLAAKGEFEGVGFLVAVGLDLAVLAERRIGACGERRQGWRVGVDGTEEGNAARTDIASAKGAFSGELALDGETVLQAIRDVQAGIKGDDAGRSGGNFGRSYGK